VAHRAQRYNRLEQGALITCKRNAPKIVRVLSVNASQNRTKAAESDSRTVLISLVLVGWSCMACSAYLVSRNPCAWPPSTSARVNRVCRYLCHLPMALCSFDFPVQKKCPSLDLGAASNSRTTKSGSTQCTGTPLFCV